MGESLSYGEAMRSAFEYLLAKYPNVFCIGQGLWAPWYVGNSMTELEKKFGVDRVLDSPVSEAACTGAAIGASLCGYKPIVVHPRVDFLILAIDQIVTQAAKWNSMFGGQASPAVTFRGIVNRGGEQGSQHSQALHAWFAHIPGLRVVMPYSPADARDLLIASVLDESPVLFIDDRWLYDNKAELPPITEKKLSEIKPSVVRQGTDVTMVGASFSVELAVKASEELASRGISAEVIDLRVVNPLDRSVICESVRKTGRLCAVDGGWETCGLAAEIVCSISENLDPTEMKAAPVRITLPDAPAPTSKALEAIYYPSVEKIVASIERFFKGSTGQKNRTAANQ